MCSVNELFKEYNLDTTDIPLGVLNITLENITVDNFSKGYINDDIIYFTGSYAPNWIEEDVECNLELKINLKRYTKKLIHASSEFVDGVEPSVELTHELFHRFITEEVVSFTQTVKDNFTYYSTYNILGSMIFES